MYAFTADLFGFDRQPTPGEALHHRSFEAFVVFWVVYFAWSWGLYIDKIGAVVLPLGIAEYIDISFMFNGPAPLVNAGLMTVTALLGFFGPWKYGYLASLLLMHLQYTTRFCLGEISHGSNIVGICLLGLALGALAFDTRTQSLRFALGFGYFTLGLGYTSAAFCKLFATGPLWVDGSHLWMWIAERTVDTYSMTGYVEYNAVQELAMAYRPVAAVILTFGLITESLGFLTWFPRTRLYIATLLIAMHIGIMMTMKIDFPANNVALIVLGFPWDRWTNSAMGAIPGIKRFERTAPGDLESQEG